MSVDIETIKTRCEEYWKSSRAQNYLLQLSDTQAAKIMDEFDETTLECEYAWLEYCAPLIDCKLVVLPKPHGPLIKHGKLTILVMNFVGGVAVEDMLKDGEELSDYTASKICNAYLALRAAIRPKTDELCPCGSWFLQGHIFKPFNEGGLFKSSRTVFSAYIDDRLTQAYDGEETILARDEVAWNHGDISPHNIKILDDGRIAFYDLGMALWGPSDWDLFALFACSHDSEFVEPMERAFSNRGLKLREDRKEMYWKFMAWHALMGGPVAREERKKESAF